MKIYKGYVLEANESEQASKRSYDDMVYVGEVRLNKKPEVERGDDLNDAPYNCNGGIYDGKVVKLKKGDYLIVIREENNG